MLSFSQNKSTANLYLDIFLGKTTGGKAGEGNCVDPAESRLTEG